MRKVDVAVPTGVELFYKTASTEISKLEDVRVKEIMTRKVTTVSPTMTVDEFLDKIAKHHHTGFPVTDELNKIVGIVTLQDAMKVAKENRNSVSVREIATKDLLVVLPDDTAARALEEMSQHDVGRLLVVDGKHELSLLGILTRSDVMHALRKNI